MSLSARQRLKWGDVLSDETHDVMLERFSGSCWICKKPERVTGRSLAIDHDHRTGAIRGLLCTSCNVLLGGVVDAVWLARAATYLKEANAVFADNCSACRDSRPVMPNKIIRGPREDYDGVVFGYRCKGGHEWTCYWRARSMWGWVDGIEGDLK